MLIVEIVFNMFFYLLIFGAEDVCKSLCVCMCKYVRVSSTAETAGPILMKVYKNSDRIACVAFLIFFKF